MEIDELGRRLRKIEASRGFKTLQANVRTALTNTFNIYAPGRIQDRPSPPRRCRRRPHADPAILSVEHNDLPPVDLPSAEHVAVSDFSTPSIPSQPEIPFFQLRDPSETDWQEELLFRRPQAPFLTRAESESSLGDIGLSLIENDETFTAVLAELVPVEIPDKALEVKEKLKTICKLPFPEIPQRMNIPIEVMLASPQEDSVNAGKKHASLDIVCVIDVSHSMDEFRRLQYVKRSLWFLSEILTEQDRLAIVPFNHKVEQTFPLCEMTSENKRRLISYVHQLSAFGGTNIAAGIEAGLSLLRARAEKKECTCLFFLSDGEDDDPDDAEARVVQTIQQFSGDLPDSGNAFGIGSDHDVGLSRVIAENLNGQYLSVTESEEIVSAIVDSVAFFSTLRLRDIQVRLIRQDCGVEYEISRSPYDSEAFTLPPMPSNTTSSFTFELRVDGDFTRPTTIRPIRIEISYRGAQTGRTFTEVIEPEIRLAASGDENSQTADTVSNALVEIYIMQGANALRQTIQMAGVGQLEAASAIARRAIENLQQSVAATNREIQRLVSDLDTAARHLNSSNEWDRVRSDMLRACTQYLAHYSEDVGNHIFENPFVEEVRRIAENSQWIHEDWNSLSNIARSR